MDKTRTPRVLWLTNIPTPYRIPIWTALDRKVDLKLIFLNQTEHGRDWELEKELEHLNYRILGITAFYPSPTIPIYFNFFRPIREIVGSDGSAIYIDGWESPAFFVSALFAKKKQMKVIYGYRGTRESHRFKNSLIRKVQSIILSQADYIATAGEASTKAVEAMGISPTKIITLFNPVDVRWFHSYTQANRTPQSEGHRFIYVGQLIERKNVASIIQAFAAIKDRDDMLTIVGDGPLASDLKKLAYSLSVEDSVLFVGHKNQDELARLYAANNTFILVSTKEVWGLVINEAIASGLHVVVSDKCGAAEFVKNMKGAYICSPDQDSIQNAMIASSQQWSTYIEEPEILKFTPEKFADDLIMRIFH